MADADEGLIPLRCGLGPPSPGTLAPLKQMNESKQPKSMRDVMPMTARWVDELRAELGQARANAIVKRGMQGKGGFWACEVGPDGVAREVGSKGKA